jgi:hypothetical protein
MRPRLLWKRAHRDYYVRKQHERFHRGGRGKAYQDHADRRHNAVVPNRVLDTHKNFLGVDGYRVCCDLVRCLATVSEFVEGPILKRTSLDAELANATKNSRFNTVLVHGEKGGGKTTLTCNSLAFPKYHSSSSAGYYALRSIRVHAASSRPRQGIYMSPESHCL